MFFGNLKNKFNKLIDKVYSSFIELKNKIIPTKSIDLNSENIKVYHHLDFSYIFIDLNKINLLSEQEFDSLLNSVINSLEIHLNKNNSVLINIIPKIIFKDELGIIYTHSLTSNMLFTLNNLDNWKTTFERDIRDLLSQYNDSKITKLEFRCDYIRSNKN